jgi:tetratricopeptide (TPR) repeat protein
MQKLILFIFVLALGSVVAQAGMELTSARVYRKQGDFKKALEWYDKEIEAHPESAIGYYEKGELLGKMADEGKKPALFLEMRKAFDAVLNLADKDPKKVKKYRPEINGLVERYWIFQYNDAVEKFRLADNDSALNAYASRLAPDAWANLGRAERDSLRNVAKTNFWNQSRATLDIALAIDPQRWEAYALVSNIQSAARDMEGAESSLRNAIEKHPRPTEAKAGKTTVRQTEAEWRRTHLDMMENLMQILYELKRYKETVDVCNDILALDSQDLVAIKFVAFSWNQLGERDKAIDAYETAIAAQPDNPDLLYNAAQLYIQVGDTAQAIDCLSDIIAIDPADFEVVFQLGVIYLEGGTFTNNEKAKELFGNATEYFPDNPVIWTNYGVALIRTGQTEEGKQAIEKAKALKGE